MVVELDQDIMAINILTKFKEDWISITKEREHTRCSQYVTYVIVFKMVYKNINVIDNRFPITFIQLPNWITFYSQVCKRSQWYQLNNTYIIQDCQQISLYLNMTEIIVPVYITK